MMKKNLNEWLDGSTAEELEGLISAYEADASLQACDLPRLKKAVRARCGLKQPTGKRSFLRVGFPILAACACLCLIGGGIFRGMIQRAEDPVVLPDQSEETDGNAEESRSDPRPSGMEEWLNQFEKDKIVWGEVQEEKPVETSDSPETEVPPDGESQNPVQTDGPLWEDPGSQVSEYYDWHGLELQYYLYVQIINTPADSSNLFAIKVDSAGEKAKAILEEFGAYDYRGNLFLICNIKTLCGIAEKAEDDAFDGAFFFFATRQDLGLEDPEPIIPNATDAPVLDETGMEWGTSVPDTDGWGWEDETVVVYPPYETDDWNSGLETWGDAYDIEGTVNYNTLRVDQALMDEFLNGTETEVLVIGVTVIEEIINEEEMLERFGEDWEGEYLARWKQTVIKFLSRAAIDGEAYIHERGVIARINPKSFDVLFEALAMGEEGSEYLQHSRFSLIQKPGE